MRWLLVSAQHHPSHGGIGTYVSRLIDAANANGWHVELVTRPSNRLPPARAVHLVETADASADFAMRVDALRRIERIRPYRYALWSIAVAERLARLEGPWDGIEFVDCQAEGYASLLDARVRMRFPGTPFVVHSHTPMWIDERIAGADGRRFGRSIYHAWERRSVAAADGVLCTSSRLAAELPAIRPPVVIPYPIDLAETPPEAPSRREEIVLVGSVQPRKGVEVWMRSLARVLRERPRARAVLIGPDTPTSPAGTSMVAYARGLLAREFLDRFEWTGPLAHDAAMERVAHASVLVVPSLYESFSFAAVEAIDRRTPVIVSDCVGIAEHVDGLHRVPTGDPGALADAQLAALRDSRAAARRAAAVRDALCARCSGAEHLRRRAAFAGSIVPNPTAYAADAIDALRSFVATVERAEISARQLSSSERS
jgi:glycosyltransferase involved in cell wall biosynthesis